jgi:hypothetical protein
VLCDNGRVVDEKEGRGYRWEQSGGYERISEIRGMTCLMGSEDLVSVLLPAG